MLRSVGWCSICAATFNDPSDGLSCYIGYEFKVSVVVQDCEVTIFSHRCDKGVYKREDTMMTAPR